MSFIPHIRQSAICIFFTAGLAVLFGSNSVARGDELLRAAETLQAKYAADIKQLAAWCEEKGLKEQARQTLAALGPQNPLKFYVPILPVDVAPAKLPDGASPEMIQWDNRLKGLQREQANALYDLARRAVRSQHAALALQLALEAVVANPDNEPLRRLLGYQKYQNQWRTLFEVQKLRAGMVWHDKFGWLPQAHVRRYEDGQRYYEGKWISSEEDAKLHSDIRSGWDIETEHYSIRTNHSLQAGAALAVKLESLYRLWQQMFIRYCYSETDVISLFDGRSRNQHPAAIRHQVVYFRDREDYNRSLRAALPNIEISVGTYLDSMRIAYFFADKQSDDRTIYHEATHQLFHESREVASTVGRRWNFWIIEGIAMYMESLRKENGYYVLGGADDERMLAARYRLLNDHFHVPLEQLSDIGMEKFQKDPKIATLYSQSAGLMHFLVHYDHGRYRDALVAYITTVYTGQDGPETLSQLTGATYSDLDKQYHQFMEQAGLNSRQ